MMFLVHERDSSVEILITYDPYHIIDVIQAQLKLRQQHFWQKMKFGKFNGTCDILQLLNQALGIKSNLEMRFYACNDLNRPA